MFLYRAAANRRLRDLANDVAGAVGERHLFRDTAAHRGPGLTSSTQTQARVSQKPLTVFVVASTQADRARTVPIRNCTRHVVASILYECICTMERKDEKVRSWYASYILAVTDVTLAEFSIRLGRAGRLPMYKVLRHMTDHEMAPFMPDEDGSASDAGSQASGASARTKHTDTGAGDSSDSDDEWPANDAVPFLDYVHDRIGVKDNDAGTNAEMYAHWKDYAKTMDKLMYEDFLIAVMSDAEPGDERTYTRNMELRAPAARSMCSLEVNTDRAAEPPRSDAFFGHLASCVSKTLTQVHDGIRVAMTTRLQSICDLPYRTIARAAVTVRDNILPYTELTPYMLATTYGIYLTPRLLSYKSMLGVVNCIAEFHAVYRGSGLMLTGEERMAGYHCAPAAEHVSAQSLADVVYGVHEALVEYDVRWDDMKLSEKFKPVEGTTQYANMKHVRQLTARSLRMTRERADAQDPDATATMRQMEDVLRADFGTAPPAGRPP